MIDRKVWRGSGADGAAAERAMASSIDGARPAGHDRPWARGAAVPAKRTTRRRHGQQPRDATPRAEDLEAGD